MHQYFFLYFNALYVYGLLGFEFIETVKVKLGFLWLSYINLQGHFKLFFKKKVQFLKIEFMWFLFRAYHLLTSLYLCISMLYFSISYYIGNIMQEKLNFSIFVFAMLLLLKMCNFCLNIEFTFLGVMYFRIQVDFL